MGLALACSGTQSRPEAAIAAAREANEAALAACVALDAQRQDNAKLDAFCAELKTHADALNRLEQITEIMTSPADVDAGGGSSGAGGGK